MANLTIRKLDDAIRDELRLRAARNGRSVEDEVRVILREAAQGQAARTLPARCSRASSRVSRCRHALATRHPDHRRWHRRLQIS
jgi:phosphopantothenoylcysteine decarboxylase/phosphopantothenate--cysteine ligase